ncbi:hypothetical protein OPV22_021660 [Ensete ventricosum]|uniref:Uncharacterized protein n=1 Tax=Ensete ventricosum TaxID=4639 RepID=A0AAV8QLQ2_ENSVE|nr:hypothetical protein OPV22_021660 [Ensete ventricosum]
MDGSLSFAMQEDTVSLKWGHGIVTGFHLLPSNGHEPVMEEGKRGYILPHDHLFPIVDAVIYESSFGDHMAFDRVQKVVWGSDSVNAIQGRNEASRKLWAWTVGG